MGNQAMEAVQGQQLLESIIELTGVPAPQMEKIIHEILDKTGRTVDSLTLDDFRGAMLAYLESLTISD